MNMFLNYDDNLHLLRAVHAHSIAGKLREISVGGTNHFIDLAQRRNPPQTLLIPFVLLRGTLVTIH